MITLHTLCDELRSTSGTVEVLLIVEALPAYEVQTLNDIAALIQEARETLGLVIDPQEA